MSDTPHDTTATVAKTGTAAPPASPAKKPLAKSTVLRAALNTVLMACSQVLTQFRRELAGYFYAPLAYLVFFFFVALTGLGFFQALMQEHLISMRATFLVISGLLLLVAPLLTMHLISEERARGTIEPLLTAPIREWEVVLAKFMAAWTVFAAALLPTLSFVWVLFRISDRGPDMGEVCAGYLGVLLQGGLFLACGLCASAFFRSQLAAALLGLALCLALMMVDLLEQLIVVRDTLWAKDLVGYVSLSTHMEPFRRGIIDSRDLIYFGTLTGLLLFLAVKGIELTKWR